MLREDRAVLNGLGLIAGTNGAERLGATVSFSTEGFEQHDRLGGPLIPFVNDARPDWMPGATSIDLCWGVDDPQAADDRGLRLRWDKAVAVYYAGADEPLFPARQHRLTGNTPTGPSLIGLVLDGNHVLASVNEQLIFDFHTTKPAKGAVGIATREGVITLQGIDVRVPEPLKP